MSALLLVDDGLDRERWLAARAELVDGVTRISATDAARIMTGGASTWSSLRKEKRTGKGFGGNSYTRHGREREAAIAEFARAEFGLTPSTALVAHADRPADVATPDALSQPLVDGLGIPEQVMVPGLRYTVDAFGEYKTTVKDWATWADVPRKYHWQVVWQFHVTGAARCHFVFEAHEEFVPLHMEPRVFTIERADVLEDIEAAVERVAEWRAIESDDHEVPEVLLPLDGLLSARQRAAEAVAAAQRRVDEFDAEIRALLVEYGDAYEHEGTDANLSWTGKPRESKRFNSAAFRAKYPAAYARFTTTTTEAQPRLGISARS